MATTGQVLGREVGLFEHLIHGPTGSYRLRLLIDEKGWHLNVNGVRIRPCVPLTNRRAATIWALEIAHLYHQALTFGR